LNHARRPLLATLMLSVLFPVLAGCSILSSAIKQGMTSNPTPSVRNIKITQPVFLTAAKDGTWLPVPNALLRGQLRVRGAANKELNLSTWNPETGLASVPASEGDELLEVSASFATATIASTSRPIDLNATLTEVNLRPILKGLAITAPKAQPKLGETIKLEYFVFTAGGLRVQPDEAISKSALITGDVLAASVTSIDDRFITLKIAGDAKVGGTLGLKLTVKNATNVLEQSDETTVTTGLEITLGSTNP
jgi:hypothetical protein